VFVDASKARQILRVRWNRIDAFDVHPGVPVGLGGIKPEVCFWVEPVFVVPQEHLLIIRGHKTSACGRRA